MSSLRFQNFICAKTSSRAHELNANQKSSKTPSSCQTDTIPPFETPAIQNEIKFRPEPQNFCSMPSRTPITTQDSTQDHLIPPTCLSISFNSPVKPQPSTPRAHKPPPSPTTSPSPPSDPFPQSHSKAPASDPVPQHPESGHRNTGPGTL